MQPNNKSPEIEFSKDDITNKNNFTEGLNHSTISTLQNGSSKSTRTIQSADNNSDLLLNTNLRFGWKCVSSQRWQLFNKPVFFLMCACLAGLGEGLVMTGISFATLTSIEKQFGYTTSEVAFFVTTYEIAYGICGVVIGYVGHSHKPKCIGLGLLLMSVGAVVLTIPKYISGPFEAGVERKSDFCHVENASNKISCDDNEKWYYQLFFILGYVILGIGAVPLFTLIPAHLDEVTSRDRSSLFMGIYFAFSAIGPALGFIIAMPVLNKWVDLKQPPGSYLNPSDTNWVGAWWLGFLIGAALLLVPVIPMLGFPSEFPDTKVLRHNKMQHEDSIAEDMALKHDLKSIWPATKSLIRKVPYLFVSLAIASESLAIGGYATFLPKFIHTQFYINASDSALYTGIIVIPGAAGGIFVGGYIIKRYGWNCKQILRFSTAVAFLATLCCAFALVGCEGRKVVGQEYNKDKEASNKFTNNCNEDCYCNTGVYKPICTVDDQKTYYSPCHAGCVKNESISKEFYNCTCFAENVTYAVVGRCTNECTVFPLFAVGSILLMFFTFINNVPMLMATFRVVNEGQGSFAMGFQQIFIRFLGFIPAPIMFGALIDKSCSLWQSNICSGEINNCLEYDQAYFRYYMFALGVIPKFASFVFLFLAYRFYRLPENLPPTSIPQPATEEVIENYNVSMDL